MVNSNTYYNDLIDKGYTPLQAFQHTKEHFPDFEVEIEGKLPTPDPPSFLEQEKDMAELSQVPLPVIEVEEETSFDFKDVQYHLYQGIGKTKKIVSNRKVMITSLALVSLLLLTYFAMMIPEKTDTIVGTWVKSDGAEINFHSDGQYEDDSAFESTWDLDENILTIISVDMIWNSNGTNENYIISQTIEIKFSEDENALWIKWIEIIIDGEEYNGQNNSNCALLLKKSAMGNDYVLKSNEYREESPEWCE